jgi:hypothetical protein
MKLAVFWGIVKRKPKDLLLYELFPLKSFRLGNRGKTQVEKNRPFQNPDYSISYLTRADISSFPSNVQLGNRGKIQVEKNIPFQNPDYNISYLTEADSSA